MASVNLRGVGTQTLSLLLCYSTALTQLAASKAQAVGWRKFLDAVTLH